MQRIKILENDNTMILRAEVPNTTGTVLVPGFSSLSLDHPDAAPVNTLVECRTVTDFYRQFGSKPAELINNYYPVLTAETDGFPDRILPPAEEKMFKGNYDIAWLLADKLLKAGVGITYVRLNSKVNPADEDYDVSPAHAYAYMFELFNDTDKYNLILDKGLNISFITSGGYPTLEHSLGLDIKMEHLCDDTYIISEAKDNEPATTGRGDCVALIDHVDNPNRELIGDNSVFAAVNSPGSIDSSFAAVFTPWCNILDTLCPTIPASFIYLFTLGLNGITTSPWIITAGVNRGYVNSIKSLNTNKTLTNKIADEYQNDYSLGKAKSSINPITYIRNYGYCIWGNRTLAKYETGAPKFATLFLNIRNLVSEIKKRAHSVSQELMFDYNTDTLWTRFKLGMGTVLDKMVASNSLISYYFTKYPTDDSSLLKASITVFPAYGLEKVELSINLENDATLDVIEQE